MTWAFASVRSFVGRSVGGAERPAWPESGPDVGVAIDPGWPGKARHTAAPGALRRFGDDVGDGRSGRRVGHHSPEVVGRRWRQPH